MAKKLLARNPSKKRKLDKTLRDHNLLLKDSVILLKNNIPLYNDFEINSSNDTSSELSHWIISLSDINLNDEGVYSIYINQTLEHLFILSIKLRCLQRKSIILSKDKFNLHEYLEFNWKNH